MAENIFREVSERVVPEKLLREIEAVDSDLTFYTLEGGAIRRHTADGGSAVAAYAAATAVSLWGPDELPAAVTGTAVSFRDRELRPLREFRRPLASEIFGAHLFRGDRATPDFRPTPDRAELGFARGGRFVPAAAGDPLPAPGDGAEWGARFRFSRAYSQNAECVVSADGSVWAVNLHPPRRSANFGPRGERAEYAKNHLSLFSRDGEVLLRARASLNETGPVFFTDDGRLVFVEDPRVGMRKCAVFAPDGQVVHEGRAPSQWLNEHFDTSDEGSWEAWEKFWAKGRSVVDSWPRCVISAAKYGGPLLG